MAPLGVKRARLQSNWAKTEQEKGKYNWWMDTVINYLLSAEIQPWVQLSYGNPIYKGGGTNELGGKMPFTPEAQKAWDKWVKATVERYKGKVIEWEIWNEPEFKYLHTPDDYARLYIRTAEIIRQIHPEAKIIALSFGWVRDQHFINEFFSIMKNKEKMNIIDIVSLHGYYENPSDTYIHYDSIRQVIDKYNPDIPIWQGENGSPSGKTTGALSKGVWNETIQAKWNLRRSMGDIGRDMVSSIFTIADLYYSNDSHAKGINSKGLLKVNRDKTIEQPKMAYSAYQNVTAIFDSTLVRLKTIQVMVEDTASTEAFAYRHKSSDEQLIVFWDNSRKPSDATYYRNVTVNIKNMKFSDPVFVDLLTGEVYQIPKDNYSIEVGYTVFKEIPLYDSPVIIAENSLIPKK